MKSAAGIFLHNKKLPARIKSHTINEYINKTGEKRKKEEI